MANCDLKQIRRLLREGYVPVGYAFVCGALLPAPPRDELTIAVWFREPRKDGEKTNDDLR